MLAGLYHGISGDLCTLMLTHTRMLNFASFELKRRRARKVFQNKLELQSLLEDIWSVVPGKQSITEYPRRSEIPMQRCTFRKYGTENLSKDCRY